MHNYACTDISDIMDHNTLRDTSRREGRGTRVSTAAHRRAPEHTVCEHSQYHHRVIITIGIVTQEGTATHTHMQHTFTHTHTEGRWASRVARPAG